MIVVRQFEETDAGPAAALIRQNLLEVNSRDYPEDEIRRLVESYSADKLMELSREMHLYVASDSGQVIGCGAIGQPANLPWPGASMIKAVFVRPDMQGFGIGQSIMRALENDDFGKTASTIILYASKTAHGFYEQIGYRDAGSGPEAESRGLHFMKKQK